MIIILTVLFMGLYVAADFAMLIINVNNDCNNALVTNGNIGDSTYIPIDMKLDRFMMITVIVHLILIISWIGGTGLICALTDRRRYNITMKYGFRIAYGLFAMFWGLIICVWSIGAFMIYSEMNQVTRENKLCADIVLSWSILRIVDVLIMPCLSLLWIKYMDSNKDMVMKHASSVSRQSSGQLEKASVDPMDDQESTASMEVATKPIEVQLDEGETERDESLIGDLLTFPDDKYKSTAL